MKIAQNREACDAQHQGAVVRKGWQVKTIGDVCEVMNGGTPKSGVPEYWNGIHRWITPAEMGKRLSPYVSDTARKITDQGLRDSSARMLPPNSVILSSRAPIGHLVINTEPMGTNQGCKGLIPGSSIETKFLYYYLSSIVDLLNSLGTGATFKELAGSKLKEVIVPVPPLAEQHRIVAILDEAFESIAIAKANTEKNLQNARVLFESHLESIFTERGEGWVVTTLGAEIDLLVGFAFKSEKYSIRDDDIPLLRGDNIVQGCLRWNDVKRWPRHDTAAYERYWLREADVVLAMDRPWVKAGLKHAAITFDDLPCLLVQRTACIRCKPSLNPRFLVYLIRGSAFTRHILGVQTGIGVPHISGQQIKDFVYAMPAVVDQKRIAQKLDALAAEIRNLESLYQQKLTALDDLKKSLLHQAFSGAL
ncbi:MAG: restriction endonuclease subunit S [Burkholderiales bacterium]|jgi:type I restriction enzyme S subunit